MPKDEKQENEKANKSLQKYLEKYNQDPNAFAKAFAELEAKLGNQGGELGTLRKQMEQQTQYLSQVTPIVQWYNQNHAQLPVLFEYAKRGAMASQQPQQPQYAQNGQAAAAQAQAMSSILTADEQNALVDLAAKRLQEQALNPWMQGLMQRLDQESMKRGKAIEDSLMTAMKSNADVIWRTFEHILPKEQVEKAKEWHKESLRFADPRNIDPMTMGQEYLSMRTKTAQLEQEMNDWKKKYEDKERESSAFLSGVRPTSINSTLEKPPDGKTKPSKDDRMAAVMGDVRTQHGDEGMRQLFG